MTKDIGIVFLPNQECKDFALKMTKVTAQTLPHLNQAQNNPHITAIHIANLDDAGQQEIKTLFKQFTSNWSGQECIALPIWDVNATGGNNDEGYKWLDLQFRTVPSLAMLRQEIVNNFCPLHNGILTRMHDDLSKFNQAQLADIEKCGVTFSSYLPHITAWYIDLPNEDKNSQLQEIAISLKEEAFSKICFAQSIALVELGRNGNAINILDQVELCGDSNVGVFEDL